MGRGEALLNEVWFPIYTGYAWRNVSEAVNVPISTEVTIWNRGCFCCSGCIPNNWSTPLMLAEERAPCAVIRIWIGRGGLFTSYWLGSLVPCLITRNPHRAMLKSPHLFYSTSTGHSPHTPTPKHIFTIKGLQFCFLGKKNNKINLIWLCSLIRSIQPHGMQIHLLKFSFKTLLSGLVCTIKLEKE